MEAAAAPPADGPRELSLTDEQLRAHGLVNPVDRETIAALRLRPGRRPTVVFAAISPEVSGGLEELLLAEKEGRKRVLTPAAEARRLFRAGYSVREIARAVSKSLGAVQSYVRGIEPPRIAKLSTDVHEFVDVSAHLRDGQMAS